MSTGTETETRHGPRLLAWIALFLVATGLARAFRAPHDRLSRYLYNDAGASLVAPGLLARGLRPTLDFGYLYGLLPLELTNLRLPGRANPWPLPILTWLSLLGLAVGLARFVPAAEVGPIGVVFILLAIPDLLQTFEISTVQTLEPVLLVHALAFQVRGHRGAALALTTADLFVKPAMAYVQGFLLVVSATVANPRGFWRALWPSAIVGGLLASWLGWRFGFVPLSNTLWPGAGMEVYRQNHYGFFFGEGRAFWLIPGGTPRDYLRYEVGAWLAGSALLAAGGAGSLSRLIRRESHARIDEIVLTCALMHFSFVFFFYGQRLSWKYYYVVLVCGLAAMSGKARPRWRRWGVGLVALLTLIGSKAKFEETARLWRVVGPADQSAGNLGPRASPIELAEWAKVKEFAAERGPAAFLARTEGGAALEPRLFLAPETLFLVPGHPTPPEIHRKAQQIARAMTLVRVRPKGDSSRGGFERWPEIANALKHFQTIWEGEFYEVARRMDHTGGKPNP